MLNYTTNGKSNNRNIKMSESGRSAHLNVMIMERSYSTMHTKRRYFHRQVGARDSSDSAWRQPL